MESRRKMERFELELPVLVAGEDPGGETFREETVSKDICSQGARVLMQKEVKIGEDYNLTITVSLNGINKQQYDLHGRVVRIDLGGSDDPAKKGVAFYFDPAKNKRFLM